MSGVTTHSSQENQLVNFKLGSEEYGIDIVRVQEIIKVPEITRVPWAPDYVEGVINLRGTILPIIDTRKRFNMEPFEQKETTRIVVASIDGVLIGMIVDSVSEVLRIDSRDVEPPPPIITSNNVDYLVGIGKLLGGKRLISLLDLTSIFRSDAMDEQFVGLTRHKSRKIDDRQSEGRMEEEVQLVSFQLGSEEYAMDINMVEEIIRIPEIKKVPDVPDFIQGVISLRGKVLPVICLRRRFGMMEKEPDSRSRILVVRSSAEKVNGVHSVSFGMVVDLVNEVLTLPVSAIDPPPTILWGDSSSYLRGVGKLQGGKRLILMLDVTTLMQNFSGSAETTSQASLKELPGYEGEKKRMANERQLVSFKIGREEFGIDIMKVQEIIRMTEITEIPGSPYYIEGVVNLRGEVLPVLDLRKRFGLDEQEKCDSNRIVVVNEDKNVTGVIVDSVSEVLQLNDRQIEPPPRLVSGVDGDFIEGIGKLNNGERFIIMLNLRSILNLNAADNSGDLFMDTGASAEIMEPVETIEQVTEEHTLEMPALGEFAELADLEEVMADDSSSTKAKSGSRSKKKQKARD